MSDDVDRALQQSVSNEERWNARHQGPPRELQQRTPTGHRLRSAPTSRIGNYAVPTDPSNAWKQQTILSLDGGGIRGYWSLLALQRLMYHIGQEEKQQDALDRAEREKTEGQGQTDLEAAQLRTQPQPFAAVLAQDPGPLSSFHPIPYDETASRKQRSGTYHSIDEKTGKTFNISSQRYLPVHYFDYMCGSSTGALIALMLGRFRMTVDDCIEEYETLGSEIFGNPRTFTYKGISLFNHSKYDTNNVKRVYEELVKRREGKNRAHPCQLGYERGICKICAATNVREKPSPNQPVAHVSAVQQSIPIRSYHTQSIRLQEHVDGRPTLGMDRDWKVVDVARAATAAPFFFDELEKEIAGGKTIILTDGGLGQHNNPTSMIYSDVQNIHGKDNIGTVVSIGTSRKDAMVTRNIFSRIKGIIDAEANPEDTHRDMATKARIDGVPYFRFNEPGALDIPLDDWRPKTDGKSGTAGHLTIEKIKQRFNAYYSKRYNFAIFTACARQLVARRRARSNDDDLWERFATASSYRCDCREFTHRAEFKTHLEQTHADWITQPINNICSKYRRQWEYQRATGL